MHYELPSTLKSRRFTTSYILRPGRGERDGLLMLLLLPLREHVLHHLDDLLDRRDPLLLLQGVGGARADLEKASRRSEQGLLRETDKAKQSHRFQTPLLEHMIYAI